MTLGQKLKELRIECMLTMADVQQITGIDKAALSRLENGVAKNPVFSTVAKLVHTYDMDVSELKEFIVDIATSRK